jgi:hypothetical protein
MGYEVDLYLGEVSDFSVLDDKGIKWFSVCSMIDLSKPGYSSNIIKVKGEVPVYFYGTDGNTKITEDRYGEKLMAVKAQTLLDALEKDFKESKKDYGGKGYRRFEMAVDLLKVFIKRFNNPMAVLFGH